jgi:hypothetical protein
MKQFLALAAFLFQFAFLVAQQEELNDLEIDPGLYNATRNIQHPKHILKYLVDKQKVIVSTDTLGLPFVDDFSTNRMRSYKWIENHIDTAFYNVFGTCLGNEGIATIPGRFMTHTSWSYVYNLDSLRIDSFPKNPIKFTFFGISPSACFTAVPQDTTYWPEYYTYTFDTTTGRPTDSTLVVDSLNHIADSIDYAPVIYFAKSEPGTLWFDNYAYVNNTYPINPPTIGVATLDGLNELGLPYNNANQNTYGTADYLTSLPINLSTLTQNDSLRLSFFYEPKGLGDYPDLIDSLIVEFKDNSGAWRMMWSDTGYSALANVPDTFKIVMVDVPALPNPYSFYHNTFQFRFRNKASLYGNNDHWHIDYVRFGKNVDTLIQDIAFVYPFPTILKNFTQMPADQFNNPSDLRDSIVLTVHNLDPNAISNPPATNFVKGDSELYPTPLIVAPDLLQTFNAGPYSFIQVNPSTEYTIPAGTVDSLVLLSKVSINPNDDRHENDTLYHTQNFNSVMAYDDGSAERSYGISGLGIKKFAYEFNLNQPDTLAAFQFQFSQVDDNVSNLIFNFSIWDSIQINGSCCAPIFSIDNKKPFYIDSVNGFTTYKLDTPIIVSGKVYVGWEQTDTRRLQVGYDLNSTLGRKHMFIFTGITWKASTITPEGSPMIRLIFDSNFWGGTSGVKDIASAEAHIQLFPNPTNGIIYMRSENQNALFETSVMNMMGQLVKAENAVKDHIDISELQNGVYLLSLRDITSGKTYHSKVIKTAY